MREEKRKNILFSLFIFLILVGGFVIFLKLYYQTKISYAFHLFLAQIGNGVGIYATVPPNPYNTLAKQLAEKEQELNEREIELKEREKVLESNFLDRKLKSLVSVFILLFLILFVLLLLNFYLDFHRNREVELKESDENNFLNK